ncbi:MAG: acyl-CoA desaturase [Acidobacteriia bacterium]|nr:acyl-CoA desaturase [Terriglobia bacterium]
MVQKRVIESIVEDSPIPRPDSDRNLKFGKDNSFQVEIRDRVEEYFRRTGRRQRDCPQMYLKTAILLACFAGFYVLLVVVARTWWQALPLAVLLGLSTAAIGFNVQHDGGHQAYSNFPWVNKAMAMTLDLVGASSYLWHWKHGVFHHTYVNITGEDPDIDLGIVGRQTPYQRSFGFHRWQHIYLWPLYGFMAIKWHLYDDFREVIAGQIRDHRFPRPRGKDLVIFLLGKAAFFSLIFVIPVLFHPVWVVLLFYGATSLLLGMVLSVVFQLAHTVEQAEFPRPAGGTGSIENAWAIHQVETTVDFSRQSRMAAWLLGGLNFQIEHHLFPRICHVNYPAISKLVEETCHKFGLKYNENRSFWAGVASHFRWLRQMGTAQDGTRG